MLSKKIRQSVLAGLNTVLIYNKQFCYVTLGDKRRVGEIIGYNQKTLWVRIMQGAKSYITVKRNFKKHNVSKVFRSEEII